MLAPSCRGVAEANGDHPQHTQVQLARLSVDALFGGGSQDPVPCLSQAVPTPAIPPHPHRTPAPCLDHSMARNVIFSQLLEAEAPTRAR